jgi:hypothetical protein
MLRRDSGSYMCSHCTATSNRGQSTERRIHDDKESKLKYTVPVELEPPSTKKDHSFELLDHMGLTAQAFEVMAQ